MYVSRGVRAHGSVCGMYLHPQHLSLQIVFKTAVEYQTAFFISEHEDSSRELFCPGEDISSLGRKTNSTGL